MDNGEDERTRRKIQHGKVVLVLVIWDHRDDIRLMHVDNFVSSEL